MSNYTAHNISVVKLGLKKFAETEAKKEVLRRMRIVAGKMLDLIERVFSDSSKQFPEWTANLHDATGIGIYADGRLESYMPAQRATGPQESRSGEAIWGAQELSEALKLAATTYSTGLWLVMFSAVDYAEEIEDMGSPAERGQNFFTALCQYLGIDIKNEFGTAIVGMSGAIKIFAS